MFFLLIKCSLKERLISPELFINWKAEKKGPAKSRFAL